MRERRMNEDEEIQEEKTFEEQEQEEKIEKKRNTANLEQLSRAKKDMERGAKKEKSKTELKPSRDQGKSLMELEDDEKSIFEVRGLRKLGQSWQEYKFGAEIAGQYIDLAGNQYSDQVIKRCMREIVKGGKKIIRISMSQNNMTEKGVKAF